ncbi:VOC family protein [Nonomuraea sp. SYSU D8015]|uniref:VOC family protein n=1 Tax=Nonomuraea sp. SYSU D8015 TaxID=2593644 RepID=UPI001660941F|nr:VOC family protein [Nonomuraea sp. SYSU D8015]
MAMKLDMIGILVEDMARSLAFYRELGLDLAHELDSQPHAETMLPSGLRLAWDTQENVASFMPGFQPPIAGSGRVNLAFLVDTPAEVDTLYDKLISLGYTGLRAPWDAMWGQRYALVQDPDGNGIDLFSPLN